MNTFKEYLKEKVNYMTLNQLKKQLKNDYGSKASSLKIVKIKGGVSIQTPSGQELERYNNVPKLGYTVVENALDEAKKVIAQVELWNGKKMKKSFKNQSAAEKFIKKMQDQEDVRGYNMYAESAQLEESRGDLMKNVEYLKVLNQAMKALAGSPKQKALIKKLNVIRAKAGHKPLEEADGCWQGFKKVGMKKKGDKLVPNCVPESIEEETSCPRAAGDVELNTKNRDMTIEKYMYGPLNVKEPGNYWEKVAKKWDTTVAAAKKSLCENCVAFDISPRMKDCMPGKTSDGDGELGYCWMHHFKCHSARTCTTWAKGGPIKDDKTSEQWQEKSGIKEGKGKPESWEAGFERRVVKTTDPDHKEKGYEWRIKGKDRPEVTIKLYRSKPSFAEFKKQMKRVAGHEFGG